MKWSTLALLSVLLSFPAAAVTLPEQPAVPVSDADAAVSYQVVHPPYPPEVEQALQEVRRDGGHRLVRTETAAYLAVGLGERPSGGYSLEVQQVTRLSDGSVQVIVREHQPSPGSLTTQALTYPTLVLALPAGVTGAEVEFVHAP